MQLEKYENYVQICNIYYKFLKINYSPVISYKYVGPESIRKFM
jgi:hypothetical protein